MARVLRQVIPKAPTEYDQNYISQLADAINRYIVQREAQAEVIAARFVMTDVPSEEPRTGPPAVLPDDIGTLSTGTLVLRQVPGVPRMVEVAAPPEEIIFYREYNQLSLAELEQYGPAAQEAGGSFGVQSTAGPKYLASGIFAGKQIP